MRFNIKEQLSKTIEREFNVKFTRKLKRMPTVPESREFFSKNMKQIDKAMETAIADVDKLIERYIDDIS